MRGFAHAATLQQLSRSELRLAQSALRHHQIRHYHCVLGLRPVVGRETPGDTANPGRDDHRLGKAGAEVFGAGGQDQRHEAAEDRRLMVAERTRRRADFGGEAFV